MDKFKEKIRTAVANYISSEGCSCCRDIEAHKKNTKILAELLEVPLHGEAGDYIYNYNFGQYESKE